MKRFFTELFEYNHHVNQKLSDVFITNSDTTTEKSVALFNHMLNAHHIWNSRIESRQPAFGVWELHNTQDVKIIDKTNYEQTLSILNNYDLDEIRNYSNSKRQRFTNTIRDTLFHIINHSTYHRGQIATEYKSVGLEPLVTDYIFYKR